MKKVYIALIIIASFLILAVGFIAWSLHSYTVPAQVIYGNGEVLVNNQPISASQTLKQGDIVATKQGTATMILQESVFLNIQPNTKLTLTDLNKKYPKVRQEGGRTGITFVHATTVEQFDLIQENATIHVNGTFLTVDQVRTLVAKGTVTLYIGDYTFFVQKKFLLYANPKTGSTNYDGRKEYNEEYADYTAEEKQIMAESVTEAIKSLRQQRQAEIDKYPYDLHMLEWYSGESTTQLLARLDTYDTKTAKDVDDAIKKAPMELGAMTKVAAYTKEIQSMHVYLNELK